MELLPHKLPRTSVPYSLRMLWRDRRRFLPPLLAIGLSAVLIAVQCGLVLGLVETTSAIIDHCSADVWVLPRDAPSLHQTYTFPLAWQSRLDLQPEIDRSEPYLTGMGRWRVPAHGRTELCMLIGLRLDDDSLGALKVFTPELRAALAEPGTVAVDAWEFAQWRFPPVLPGRAAGLGVSMRRRNDGREGSRLRGVNGTPLLANRLCV